MFEEMFRSLAQSDEAATGFAQRVDGNEVLVAGVGKLIRQP